MTSRERAIVTEVSDALGAIRGVDNPASQKGKSDYYTQMNAVRNAASMVLHSLVVNGATDENTTDYLLELRRVMSRIDRADMHYHVTSRHPEWFADG